MHSTWAHNHRRPGVVALMKHSASVNLPPGVSESQLREGFWYKYSGDSWVGEREFKLHGLIVRHSLKSSVVSQKKHGELGSV